MVGFIWGQSGEASWIEAVLSVSRMSTHADGRMDTLGGKDDLSLRGHKDTLSAGIGKNK
jgi:hypothetical protein